MTSGNAATSARLTTLEIVFGIDELLALFFPAKPRNDANSLMIIEA